MANVIIRYIDRFPELIVSANSRTAGAVEWAADEIERLAKSFSRVDTGNMRDGWTQEMLSHSARVVYNPVHYTIFHEDGTVHMSAQPMLRPARDQVMPEFISRVRKAWYGL